MREEKTFLPNKLQVFEKTFENKFKKIKIFGPGPFRVGESDLLPGKEMALGETKEFLREPETT